MVNFNRPLAVRWIDRAEDASQIARRLEGAMARNLSAVLACLAVGASGCATATAPGPTFQYVSWSGADAPTKPLVFAVRDRMKADPAFAQNVRFDDSLNIHIADGVPNGEGKLRFAVNMNVESLFAGRRIRKRDQVLADFNVTCASEHPEPCADSIMRRAHVEAARLRRMVRRAPKATAKNRYLP